VSNIAEGLSELRMPIDRPVLHPQNYRQGDVETIAASLRRFGQVRPIVVQKSSGQVVAGNHTLKAAISLDWDEIAAVVVDMPDEEAEAYLVADNRSSDKATNDDTVLAPILERLMLAGRLEGTGYTPDNVDDMLAALDALPEVDPGDTAAAPGATDEQLAERFANRSQVALRQFVLMYDQDTAAEVEQLFRKLERAWGMSQTRDVALEAMRRAAADPPVEGLTVEEAERANIEPEPEPAADDTAQPVPPESMPPVTVAEANEEVAAMVEESADVPEGTVVVDGQVAAVNVGTSPVDPPVAAQDEANAEATRAWDGEAAREALEDGRQMDERDRTLAEAAADTLPGVPPAPRNAIYDD
jgi:ParB-like chromosome segregation protein Spo0J